MPQEDVEDHQEVEEADPEVVVAVVAQEAVVVEVAVAAEEAEAVPEVVSALVPRSLCSPTRDSRVSMC